MLQNEQKVNQNDTEQFLNALFGSIPQNTQPLIWQPEGVKSGRFYWPESVSEAAEAIQGGINYYAGGGLSPQMDRKNLKNGKMPFSKNGCLKDKIAGIVGHWADIDYGMDGHKKSHLPPDEGAAMQILRSFPLKASIVIHSGHGLQAWWLFSEPWMFGSKAERDQASSQARRFNEQIRLLANGFDVDSVHNLNRLMRIPGTINRKPGFPDAEAEILEINAGRYKPIEFEKYLPQVSSEFATKKNTVIAATIANGLVFKANAEPPADILDSLLDQDPKFKATWLKQRDDLPSASEYDLSLMTQGLNLGLSDQQVIDLDISWRRRHNEQPEKALRQDYMLATLAKAKETATECDEKSRAAFLKQWLRTDILSVTIFRGDTDSYKVETSAGDVSIPNTDHLTNQKKLRDCFLRATGKCILIPQGRTGRKKPGSAPDRNFFLDVIEGLYAMAVIKDLGEEGHSRSRVLNLLREWINRHKVVEDRVKVDLIPGHNDDSFFADNSLMVDDDGCLIFQMPIFTRWCVYFNHVEDSRSVILRELTAVGCKSGQKINIKVRGGGFKTKNFWKVPKNVINRKELILLVIDDD